MPSKLGKHWKFPKIIKSTYIKPKARWFGEDGRGATCGDCFLPQRYINNTSTCGTHTERWQKTSDFQEGKKIPM